MLKDGTPRGGRKFYVFAEEPQLAAYLAGAFYQIPLSVKPTGGGDAELVPPEVLQGLNYRFVIVKEGGEEGIVELDEPQQVLQKVARHEDCAKLTE